MNAKEYQELALRTKSDQFHVDTFNNNPNLVDMFHATIGVVTEAGEMMDAWKKSIFYGKPLDIVNLKEEVGDVLWYLAVFAEAAGTTLEEIMATNIAKLQARFPNKFTTEKALNRDLDTERKILEG